MTKPLPTGCIKNDTDLSWQTFHLLLESVSLNDKIGHLYIVDIFFDHKNATKQQIVYNEIYPPIVEKQKAIDPCEKSLDINYLIITEKVREVHFPIKQMLKHIQLCYQKNLFRFIWRT